MRVFVDIPRYFWNLDDPDRADVRTTYVSLLAALLRLECEVVARPYRPFAEVLGRPDPAEGVYYAYHARDIGPHAYCVKGAALPDLWYMDRGGYSGWCELARDAALQAASADHDLARADAVIAAYRDRFRTENLSRYAQPARDTGMETNESFAVFYPLQVNDDEVLKLSRFAQFEVLEALANLAEREGRGVVIKRHPLCRSAHISQALDDLAGRPWVTILDASVHDLIERSETVLVANSGVGLQALIHGKPVFSLAGSEYAHMTTPLEQLSDLPSLMTPPGGRQSERIRRQLGFLLDAYWVNTRDEEAVLQRVKSHVEAWREAFGSAAVKHTGQDRMRSNLHAMERRALDMVDHMLRLYDVSEGETRDHIGQMLFRSYRLGLRSERILRLMPDRGFLRRCLGHDLKHDVKPRALRAARALAAAPDATAADLLLCGKTLCREGAVRDGLAALRRGAAHPKANIQLHTFLSRWVLKVEQAAGAAEALEQADRALNLEPDLAMGHWLRARALLFMDRMEEAYEAAARAATIEPADVRFTKFLTRLDQETAAPAP